MLGFKDFTTKADSKAKEKKSFNKVFNYEYMLFVLCRFYRCSRKYAWNNYDIDDVISIQSFLKYENYISDPND